MKLALALGLGAFMVSGRGAAADWWTLTFNLVGPLHSVTFINGETEEMLQDKVRTWELTIYEHPISSGATSTKAQYEFNCATRTAALTYFVTYRRDGSVLVSQSVAAAPEPLVPDSNGESAFMFACWDKGSETKRLANMKRTDGREETPEMFAQMLFQAPAANRKSMHGRDGQKSPH